MTDLSPICKTLSVPLTPDQAFALFTGEIGVWWPLASHSLSGEKASTCAFEPRAGGDLFELDADGNRYPWGRVQVWQPPHRLVFSWFLQRDEACAQEVEVQFKPDPEGTRVELEHRLWERLGAEAEAVRSKYLPGWDFVLGRYVDLVNSPQQGQAVH